jgi:lipid II:glycine glycyltransferase (peptidoglycan interpeptide bridge formation enzyme)
MPHEPLKELVVTHHEREADGVSTAITLAGQALGDREYPVWFETSEDVGGEADFLLPLTLLPAMVTGSRLKLPGKISSRLLSTAPKIQDVFCRWDEKFQFPPQYVPVDAEVRRSRTTERASGVACFFSGGVDSFYTLLKNQDEVTHLIFVHGFDITLTNRSLRKRASHAVREVARELGKSLIEVSTNLRSFSDPLVSWEQQHGAGLASVGLLFQHLFRKVLIPSTFTYDELLPWGSHPLLDPLWSTDLTEFEHDGCEATRIDKVAYISRNETAMKWLRVCWANPDLAYNCGSCGKCLMAIVALRTTGSLERCKTLPHTIELKAIPNLDRLNEDDAIVARQNIKALERLGTDPDLTRALAKATRSPALYPNRDYRLANVLMNRVPKIPGAGRLVRPAGPGIRLREVSEPGEWNAAVKALGGSITQSWEWGLFQQRMGWKPMRLLDEEGRGAVQLLLAEQRGGFSVAYAPYGPLAANTSYLPEITASAARRARECRAYVLKVEPRWGTELGREILGAGNYVQADRELPGSTLIVRIPKDPEEHLKTLPQDTFSGVLHAQRHGVEIETLSSKSLDIGRAFEEFLKLLEDTSMRHGFSLAPAAFYRILLLDLPAYLLLARHESTPVAGAIVAIFGDEAYYLYGAFTPEEENLHALDLVHWAAIDLARRAGCLHYDLWGMPYRPSLGYWGFDPYKKRLGGTPTEYLGAYIRILKRLELFENGIIRYGIEAYDALRKPRGGILSR